MHGVLHVTERGKAHFSSVSLPSLTDKSLHCAGLIKFQMGQSTPQTLGVSNFCILEHFHYYH